jgi:hypothetical protein
MRILIPGKEFHCVSCGRDSVVHKKAVLLDWQVRYDLVCGLCGAQLLEGYTEGKTPDSAPTSGKSEKLAQFLQVEAEATSRPVDLLGEEAVNEREFCRDCRHYIHHPFLSRCSLWHKEIGPMESCERFEIKKNGSKP